MILLIGQKPEELLILHRSDHNAVAAPASENTAKKETPATPAKSEA